MTRQRKRRIAGNPVGSGRGAEQPTGSGSRGRGVGRGANPRTPGREAEDVRGEIRVDRRRGVFMISVAAELAEMHPQTLRMYEARGLITPKRSPKNTRLYSYEDVERLRRIQEMTAEEGLNLAGVETVLALERELERARGELAKMRKRTAELEQRMVEEMERVRRSLRAEIVPYGAYEPKVGQSAGVGEKVTIPIERRRRRTASD
jgi:MerR family transcriptional regulator, heat shock protein HspR